GEPILRLFRFEPPGITLGHGQQPFRELNLDRCRQHHVLWASRPTGGRAIFHAEEWTYSFAAPIADAQWGGTLSESYDRLARVLVASLDRLGVPARLAGPAAPERAAPSARTAGEGSVAGVTRIPRRGRAVEASSPCFASAARHEILRDSRKLVGSAQRRTSSALLQQGSLLLSDGHLRLADFLAVSDVRREEIRSALGASSAHIGDLVGSLAPIERWADALMEVMPVRRRVDGVGAWPLTD
ncbi:MAG: hypothetical protein HYR73_03225, partial [Candidatus Eisenbacteria bacterium]|nr:hypothetical protein [Candidatus Eisenbacteria bacterium]